MPPRTPSTGDDGSLEGRLARLEESAASSDWLSGRVAAIDSHLDRNTIQLDEQRKVLDAIALDLSAMRREAKERDAAEAERFKGLQKDSEQWVSTLPPGWRRTVGLVVAVIVVMIQAYGAFKMELR